MHGIYNLKERLCEELEEYGLKEKWDAGDLDIIDKLAHSIKNIEKILEKNNDRGYSSRYDGNYPYYGSGVNGRYNRGRYGRYSMHSDMIEELRDLMQDAPNENIKLEFQRLIDTISNSR